MKKAAISIITILILAVAITVGMSLSAMAEGESAQWDSENFGNAKWTAVDGASYYKLTLLYNADFTGSIYKTVFTKTIDDSAATSYDFIPESKTRGEIDASNTGKYKFQVEITAGETVTTVTSPEMDFVRLYPPHHRQMERHQQRHHCRVDPQLPKQCFRRLPRPVKHLIPVGADKP